ncbi:MAG: hypothetical protein BWY78_00986 [Alphaproteobacteria bacterium ADurb.Bin438]|nr:MAG: hypothetical protein BWY78_00986 [Alphaproteobacteria bacterium ADurb.Bin438]
MENYWWFFALMTSFVCSIFAYSNQIFKMHGLLLMLYRGLLVAFISIPFVLLRKPISEPYFYVFCFLQGLVVAFNDNRLFRAAKAFGAEVSSIFQPLAISLIFIMWLILTPSLFFTYISEPLKFLGIILCLAGVIYSIISLRKAKVSKIAFMFLLPALFALSVSDILNKMSMKYGKEDLITAIIYYSFITGLVSGLCNLFFYIKKKQKISNVFKRKNFINGALLSIIITLTVILKNISMHLASNPAYVSAIILLYPLWIVFGNNAYSYFKAKKTGYKKVNFKIVSLLLSSIIALVLISNSFVK